MADIESIAVDPSSLRFAEAGKVTGEVGVIFSLSPSVVLRSPGAPGWEYSFSLLVSGRDC